MPVPMEQILGAGTTCTRHILIVGDGFRTTAEMKKYRAAAAGVAKAIKDSSWYRLAPFLGVWRADTAVTAATGVLSADVGCAAVVNGPPVQFFTAFGDPANGCEVLSGRDDLVLAVKAAQQADAKFLAAGGQSFSRTLVLVNSQRYGGSRRSAIAWASLYPGQSQLIALHELGHTIGLVDEYEIGCDMSDVAPSPDLWMNTSTDPDNPPWVQSVAVEPMLRTEDSSCDDPSPYADGAVGAFEGGNRLPRGYFRPSYRCRMRDRNDEFCAICAGIIANAIDPTLPDVVR